MFQAEFSHIELGLLLFHLSQSATFRYHPLGKKNFHMKRGEAHRKITIVTRLYRRQGRHPSQLIRECICHLSFHVRRQEFRSCTPGGHRSDYIREMLRRLPRQSRPPDSLGRETLDIFVKLLFIGMVDVF